MGKSTQSSKPASPVHWGWTAALFALSAALVAAAGVMLSRQTETISLKPPGNHSDDSFRQVSRRVNEMERLWESALEDEANRLLDSGDPGGGVRVAGIVQVSRLNPRISDGARAHFRPDGTPPVVKPILAKFSRKEPGEWVFSEDQILSGSGWLESEKHPLAYRQGNGRNAVVFLLDIQAASAVVANNLKERFKDFAIAGEPGALSWEAPGGARWAVLGKISETARPDDILRHPSRFGDWTLRRFYPVRVVTHYRPPILLGGFGLAAILAICGIAVVSWQRKATRLAEQRVSFVNRVSHELRTPLTNLLLNTDLALDGLALGDAKVRRRLGLIREETSRLSRIVDNVQTFARIGRSQAESNPAPCDLAKTLAELQEIFAPLFERKSILCDYECHVTGDQAMDRDAFSQILSNLLSNVEKYAGEGSKARVTLAVSDNELVAEVSDNGPGIPAEAGNRVFLAFERVGSRVDEGATGTGLGLTISRELATRMGGQLVLLGGSHFRLTVPLAERSRA